MIDPTAIKISVELRIRSLKVKAFKKRDMTIITKPINIGKSKLSSILKNEKFDLFNSF